MTKSTPKPTSKKDQLIKLLSTKAGRDINSLSDKLGWQPHTIRAAISGLRKSGFEITRNRQATGVTRYRIVASHAPVVEAA